ncbi:AsnC family transcriptional regulator [Halosimplex carlsbadense 2-9-1]|uniref:AsnC family transcriptional regulator n=1 Tax=Halosimplex carlsbadense 2-9-1 TaxID=797114 RepID=M0D584_9EURY|nr:Lrp/AsnC family transcriptional regulator [Halosimplex carlsbadense]ELZ29334.1 AsnC family transcriptional regulator [Halosimplex carlsbadense 2-9-1]
MVDIDETDRRLVDALLADGRASANELAAEVGIATATATKRVQTLEDAGIIDGYRPRIDYGALGFGVTAVFNLDVAGDGIEAVVADLADAGDMVGVYEVTGSQDVIAIGKFTDTASLNARIKELLVDDDIESIATNIALEVVTENEPLPLAEE